MGHCFTYCWSPRSAQYLRLLAPKITTVHGLADQSTHILGYCVTFWICWPYHNNLFGLQVRHDCSIIRSVGSLDPDYKLPSLQEDSVVVGPMSCAIVAFACLSKPLSPSKLMAVGPSQGCTQVSNNIGMIFWRLV